MSPDRTRSSISSSRSSNDLRRVHPGRAQYTHLLDDDGSVVDDLIVWWIDEVRFDVMPNASNTSDVLAALGGHDVTAERAVVAIQGPEARARLSGVAPSAAAVHRFCVEPFEWHGAQCFVAGTGYTGEDGVECAVPADVATEFWEAVLSQGIAPAGLGARDTLRLEAGLPLHGHELGPGITPLQAGLGWVVGWDKPAFTGRAALEEERAAGPARRLRGFVADGRQPLRDGSTIQHGSENVGILTSGNFSRCASEGSASDSWMQMRSFSMGTRSACSNGGGTRRRPRTSAVVAGPRRIRIRTEPGRAGRACVLRLKPQLNTPIEPERQSPRSTYSRGRRRSNSPQKLSGRHTAPARQLWKAGAERPHRRWKSLTLRRDSQVQ